MGWSKDPEKRARQEAALAAGRRIRDERRAAGLPPKPRRRRVVEAGYQEDPSKPSSRGEGRGAKPQKPRSVERPTKPEGGGSEPPRWARVAGRIMGID